MLYREDEVYHLGQYWDTNKAEGERRDSVLVKPRHLTTRATVWVSRAHLHRLREGGGRQREAEQTVQPSALALKGETDRREGKASRAFPPVSYERAKAVVERETQKGTRKRYEHFRRSLKRGRKRSKENARNTRLKCVQKTKNIQPATPMLSVGHVWT